MYSAGLLRRGAAQPWYQTAPRRINPQSPDRKPDECYHFLLPDPGMANYSDAVARSLYPEDFNRLTKWRADLTRPLEDHEIKRLQQLSTAIDDLWAEHARLMGQDRARTEDVLPLWPNTSLGTAPTSRADKEAIRKQGLLNEDDDLATPYRRLKLVMDYWCALWSWPITLSESLPTRERCGSKSGPSSKAISWILSCRRIWI